MSRTDGRQPHAGQAHVVVQPAVCSYAVGALTLIVLRLTGLVTWSWWWVLSPLWISGILLAAAAAAAACALLGLFVWGRRGTGRVRG